MKNSKLIILLTVVSFGIAITSCRINEKKAFEVNPLRIVSKNGGDLTDKDFKYEKDLSIYPKKCPMIYRDGVVPDMKCAARVANAYFLNYYGNNIYKERPYSVTLSKNGIWIVHTVYHKSQFGGDAYIEIRKSDGKIMKLLYGK
jgi:hypothetical protein